MSMFLFLLTTDLQSSRSKFSESTRQNGPALRPCRFVDDDFGLTYVVS